MLAQQGQGQRRGWPVGQSVIHGNVEKNFVNRSFHFIAANKHADDLDVIEDKEENI